MQSKRKVILIGPAHPYRGGIAAFNHQLALSFLANGWEVELITYTFQYPSILFPGKDQLTNDPAPSDLQITRMIHSINPLNWSKVAKRIAEKKPDLVISQYWLAQIGYCTANIMRKIKAINSNIQTATIVHNLNPHEKKIGNDWLTNYQLASADHFVSLSNSVNEDLINTDSNLKTIPLFHPIYNQYGAPINKQEAKKKLGLDLNSNYILFFGLVRAYKGLDILIDAIAKIKDSYPNNKLLVAGEFYEDINQYKTQIKNHQLQNSVVIVDQFVDSDQVKYYFSATDLLVLPYRTATQSGITQIGLCFDKPMIVTDVGGLSEVVRDGQNGFLTAPGPDPIATAISKFYDENLEADFAKGSGDIKEELSWERFFNLLIKSLDGET